MMRKMKISYGATLTGVLLPDLLMSVAISPERRPTLKVLISSACRCPPLLTINLHGHISTEILNFLKEKLFHYTPVVEFIYGPELNDKVPDAVSQMTGKINYVMTRRHDIVYRNEKNAEGFVHMITSK